MSTTLADQECIPCRGGIPPLTPEEYTPLQKELDPAWKVVKEHHLEREFTFPDFKSALDFTNRIGELAEQQGHHPNIYLAWGLVRVEIWTHKIMGLHQSDFILAAKIDRIERVSGE